MTEKQDNFSGQAVRKPSVQSALNGEFDFEVKTVLSEGWEITQKDKLAILQGMSVAILMGLIVMAFAYELSRQKGIDFNEPGFRMGTEIAMLVLVAPFAAGLLMMGVNASIGVKIRGSHIFQFVHRTFSIVIASVLISAMVQIGILFLILPGLYLIVATGFAIPLILDKGILPARAIIISIKVVNFRWLKFVQLYLVFLGLIMLVFATFGLAMIWVVPFYYNVKGLLYRDIFGVVVDDVLEDTGEESQVIYPKMTGQDESDRTSDASPDKRKPESMPKSTGVNANNGGSSQHTDKDGFFDA